MRLFDSHTHINSQEFDNDIPDVIERSWASGVTDMLVLAYDSSSVSKMLQLVHTYPRIYGAYGIHPENADIYTDEVQSDLIEVLNHDKVVAVGEIGMDYFNGISDHRLQEKVFISQIEIAKVLKLPVTIHTRDALENTYRILKHMHIEDIGGIMHSFSGNTEWMKKFLDLGMEISYSGVVTYHNAKEVAQAALQTPLEHILVETDAPYLSPMPLRNRQNEPGYTRYTAEFLAQQRNMDIEEFAKITFDNTRRVLNIHDKN